MRVAKQRHRRWISDDFKLHSVSRRASTHCFDSIIGRLTLLQVACCMCRECPNALEGKEAVNGLIDQIFCSHVFVKPVDHTFLTKYLKK